MEYFPEVVQAVAGDRNESSCIDLDPLAVYEKAAVVPDPLVDAA